LKISPATKVTPKIAASAGAEIVPARHSMGSAAATANIQIVAVKRQMSQPGMPGIAATPAPRSRPPCRPQVADLWPGEAAQTECTALPVR
jgi:hypothetical protein